MTTQETKSLKLHKALKALAGSDPMLDYMLKQNLHLTREAYLDLSYAGDLPTPWTAEMESEIPEPLQDWEQFNAAPELGIDPAIGAVRWTQQRFGLPSTSEKSTDSASSQEEATAPASEAPKTNG